MDRHVIVILWIYWEHSLNKHTDLHRSMWQHVTNQSMNKSVRKRSKVPRFADLKWNEGSFLWASSAAKKMPLTAMEQSEIVWREAKFQFWRCLDMCSSIWSCFRNYFRSCLEFENLPELGSFTTVSDLFRRGFSCFSEFCSGMLLPSNQSSQHRRQVWGICRDLPNCPSRINSHGKSKKVKNSEVARRNEKESHSLVRVSGHSHIERKTNRWRELHEDVSWPTSFQWTDVNWMCAIASKLRCWYTELLGWHFAL